jgi:hypothetical protein
MLTLRRQQLVAMRDARRQEYERGIARRLKADLPDRIDGWSDAEIRDLIRCLVDSALSWSFGSTAAIARLVVFMVRHGIEIDGSNEPAWVFQILGIRQLSGEARMGLLESGMAQSSTEGPGLS